jgi:hypothetical protein
VQLDARRWAERLALPLAVAAVAVAYAGTLRQGFVADARFLLADNRYLDSWSYFGATLRHDYFWSSSGASIPYWRPLTKLLWLVEARLFGRGSALPFHAVQLAWLLGAAAGVGLLARRLGAPATWAALAVLLFGLHPALVEAGCLLMARSDVAVVACTLWALIAWLKWRDGSRAWAIVHVVALGGALLSKEAAVVLPAVLTVWALASSPRRLATVAPAWLLAIAYLVARRIALGAVPSASFDPLRIFVGVGVYGWGLLPLRVATGVRNLSFAEARAPATLAMAAAVWLGVVAGALVAWWRRSATALGLVALGLASLLPVLMGPTPSVPGIAGKYAFADRWLVTAAAAASVGLVLAALRLPLRGRRLVAGVLAVWCVAALIIAGAAHAYYASDTTLLDREDDDYQETPERFRTVEDRCRFRERQLVRASVRGDADEAMRLLGETPAECPADAMMRFNVASVLAQRGRFAEARPLADELLAHFAMPARYHAPLLYLAGVSALRTGDPARAEHLLTGALQEGLGSCATFARLAEATGAQGRADEAARWKQRLDACR